MPEQLKIAHIIIRLDAGGAERNLERLVKATRSRLENKVFCLGFPTSVGDDIEQAGAEIDYFDYRSPLALLKFKRALKLYSPDVVQGWMYHGNLCASLVSNTHTVWNVLHTLGDAKERWTVRLAMAWAKGRRRDLVLFNSNSSLESHKHLGFDQPKAQVVANGIDTDVFKPCPAIRERARAHLPPETEWVGFTGRFHYHKGPDVFLEAVAPLLGHRENLRIVLAGEGMSAHNQELTELLDKLSIERERVDLMGRHDQLQTLLPGLDCMVLSSRAESMPNVVLEAMACEVPVVATDVGDVQDMLRDPDRICPPENPEALRSKIESVLNKPVNVHVDRERVVEHFHIDVYGDAFVDAYRSLLQ